MNEAQQLRVPGLLLIICDSLPTDKNAFVQSILESLDYSIGPDTLILTRQYDNAQTLKAVLPFAIALGMRHFKDNSLDLDADSTLLSGFKNVSVRGVIQGHSFGMFAQHLGFDKTKAEEQ